MGNHMYRFMPWLKSILSILLLSVVVLAAGNVMAGPVKKGLKAGDGEDQQVRLPSDRVAISDKTLETVITNIGRPYALSEDTIITGFEGGQVSIRELLVPCEAEITYTVKKGVRWAVRIKVIRTGNKNSWKWKARLPE